MKRGAVTLALVAILAMAGSASAQDRRSFVFSSVAAGDPPSAGYVDKSSIKTVGDKRTAWVLWVFISPKPIESGHLSYVLRQSEYDCASTTIRLRYIAAYDTSGSLAFGEAQPSYKPADPVIPGTAGESIFGLVCGTSPQIFDQAYDLDSAVRDARSGKYKDL